MCTVTRPLWFSEASLLDGLILSLDFGRHRWLNSGHRGPKRLAGDSLAPFERVSSRFVYQKAYVAGGIALERLGQCSDIEVSSDRPALKMEREHLPASFCVWRPNIDEFVETSRPPHRRVDFLGLV